MGTFTTKNIDVLVAKIKNKPKTVTKAAQNTVNRAATFAMRESIKLITRENNLSVAYLAGKMEVSARASRTNLRAKVKAQDRRTLLSRYPFSETSDGVRVSVKRGSSKFIKNAKAIKLRSGNGVGIALRNKDFYRYLKSTVPIKSTKRAAKTAEALIKSVGKPRGWHVLHGASVNQMFTEKRQEIAPQLNRFMTKNFLEEFKRLDK